MAPISVSSTGMSRQSIDDPELRNLLERLCALCLSSKKPVGFGKPNHDSKTIDTGSMFLEINIDSLATELQRVPSWRFQEQADLYEWILPLDLIDAALAQILRTYPHILLVEPPQKSMKRLQPRITAETVAQSIQDVEAVPKSVLKNLSIILQFLSTFLRNSLNKAAFNSVEELSALLAAADDQIAALALQALSCLSSPPMLHRQQSPEVNQHSTNLHSAPSHWGVHSRLMELARGWGTKGSDLGLATCVIADDSVHGQGSLPQYPGDFYFEIYTTEANQTVLPATLATSIEENRVTDSSHRDGGAKRILTIQILGSEMLLKNTIIEGLALHASEDVDDQKQIEKRRKTGPYVKSYGAGGVKGCKSTASLFFAAVQQVGGRSNIPSDRVFPLLAQLRLAESFHSQTDRIAAIELRLHALIAILHGHPSQDILLGYFHAQPELCAEIVDLIRPTILSSTAPSASIREGTLTDLVKSSSTAEMETEHNYSIPSLARNFSLLALAESNVIPFKVRTLAVECLTALIARREAHHSGGLSSIAKVSNVLMELGVGKYQFLGFLPTLIRFSLASLNAFLSYPTNIDGSKISASLVDMDVDDPNDDVGLRLGLAFLEATKPQKPNVREKEEQALEFIDAVLTLTSAVVSVSSGTASLTECGLIPALMSTISLESSPHMVSTGEKINHRPFEESSYADSTLKFIIAQSIQILEGAIATYTNALSAFHDLHGVDLLIERICSEIDQLRNESDDNATIKGLCDFASAESADVNLFHGKSQVSAHRPQRRLRASRRALLFSLVNCLTVVFHQQEHFSSLHSSRPSSSKYLQNHEFVHAILDVFQNVESYGGVLAALICTLLSDVINSDPPVLHFVISSGLADAILYMVSGRRCPRDDTENICEPSLPPSSELLLAVSSILSTLSITADGEAKLLEHNPFPEVLQVFISSRYSMPSSRCLLSDMASIVGTALEEIIRSHSNFRPLIVNAIVQSLKTLLDIGYKLVLDEADKGYDSSDTSPCLDQSRTEFMQYAYNISQILEQILSNNEATVNAFHQSGGFHEIISLYPLLIPHGIRFLALTSAHSSPSLTSLTQSQTTVALTMAIDSVSGPVSEELLEKLMCEVERRLDGLENSVSHLRHGMKLSSLECSQLFRGNSSLDVLNIVGVLDYVPRRALHMLSEELFDNLSIKVLSTFLRDIIVIEWLSTCIAEKIKVCRKKALELTASDRFKLMFCRLSMLHRSSIYELCRLRTEESYEENEAKRWLSPVDPSYHPTMYKLRIVCPEGAVVRDGIDIDTSLHIGGVEMGELVEACDRCINSSGVMRYRTQHGWISEQTRGNGRELIAEVLSIERTSCCTLFSCLDSDTTSRTECGIPCLSYVCAHILARLQISHSSLCSSLSRAFMSAPPSNTMLDVAAIHVLTEALQLNFQPCESSSKTKAVELDASARINEGGLAMYLGYMVTMVHTCLYEEKRDRMQTLNIPLLLSLLSSDGFCEGIVLSNRSESEMPNLPEYGFLGAVRFIMRTGLLDMSQKISDTTFNTESSHLKTSRIKLSRSVAASFPIAITSIQRLLSKCSLIESAAWSSVLNKLKDQQLRKLLQIENETTVFTASSCVSFNSRLFSRGLLSYLALMISETLQNPNIAATPAHVLHPLLHTVKIITTALEEQAEPTPELRTAVQSSVADLRDGHDSQGQVVRRRWSALSSLFGDSNVSPSFQASETTLNQLVEMGFSRDHAREAIEASQSNTLEVAMEWALSHLDSSHSISRPSVRRTVLLHGLGAQHLDTLQDSVNDLVRSIVGNQGPSSQVSNEVSNPVDSERLDSMEIDTTSLDEGSLLKQFQGNADNQSKQLAKESLSKLKSGVVNAALLAIEGSTSGLLCDTREHDAVTTVASTFLLEYCDRYQSKRSEVVSEVLRRLSAAINRDSKGSQCYVCNEQSQRFASLCHAAVIFLRSLPSARPLVLRFNLVGSVAQCIRSLSLKSRHETVSNESEQYPVWVCPALLLLEIMAQPTSIELEEEDGFETTSKEESGVVKKCEYFRVSAAHKKQRTQLSKTAKKLFQAIYEKSNSSAKKKKIKKNEFKNNTTGELEENHDGTDNLALQSPFPTFLPLMTYDTAELCMLLCVQLLRGSQRKGDDDLPKTTMSPIVAHATLLLLTRVLRVYSVASQCLKIGGAELLSSLQHSSRFDGHAGLITVAYCRMLEDEVTLQAAMEAEIKSSLNKLLKKQNVSSSDSPMVSSATFIQAMVPLICRDPWIFLKAASVTVRLEQNLTSATHNRVVPLTQEERNVNMKIVTDLFRHSNHHSSSNENYSNSTLTLKNPLKVASPFTKGKSPNVMNFSSTSTKASRKEKSVTFFGDPINHVSLIMVTEMIKTAESEKTLLFLDTTEHLHILSDLVLSIPGFSSAVFKYSPPPLKSFDSVRMALKNLSNADSSCPPPSTCVINYVLHRILPQPYFCKNDKNESNEPVVNKRIENGGKISTLKLSQAAARFLVSLVARAGEGRRCVILALACALFGDDKFMSSASSSFQVSNEDQAMWALKAWGELCIGIAAPRSTGITHDSDSSLSFEVVTVMFDVGIPRALFCALQRINLNHPLAASVAAALLRPLEVFTRGSVIDSLKDMNLVGAGGSRHLKKTANVIQQNTETFEDDVMIEVDGIVDDDVDDYGGMDDDENSDNDDESDDDEDSGEDDEEDSDENEEDSDDVNDIEDEESLGSHESGEESHHLSESVDDEEVEESSDSESDDDEMEFEAEDDDNVDRNDQHWNENEDDYLEEGEEEDDDDGNINIESEVDDGWTRVEDSGLSDFFSARGAHRAMIRNRDSSHGAPEFLEQAAEALGSILRDSNLEIDALAEIENTLGVRIVRRPHRDRQEYGSFATAFEDSSRRTTQQVEVNQNLDRYSRGPTEPYPNVNQRHPPDIGFSSANVSGRLLDVNAAEYLFSMSAHADSTRSYYLPGEDHLEHNSNRGMTTSGTSAETSTLFPGGSAAFTHSRSQTTVHPLMSTLALPPFNSIVSVDNRPSRSNDRESSWSGIVASSAQGNLVRLNRVSVPQPPARTGLTGIRGWTDDLQGSSRMATDFTGSFERAFGDLVSSSNLDHVATDENASTQPVENEHLSLNPPQGVSTNTMESSAEDDHVAESRILLPENPLDAIHVAESRILLPENPPDAIDRFITTNSDVLPTEIIPLLARSRNSSHISSDIDGSGSNQSNLIDQPMTDLSDSYPHELRNDLSTGDSIMIDQEEAEHTVLHQSPTLTDTVGDRTTVDNIVSSDDNNLICPPGIDEEVFESLPIDMRQEVIESYRAEAEMIRANLEDEVPADPSNAQEMDNASFIASLAPGLREDILRTSDEAFLNTLPPEIIAEAHLLRERANSRFRRSHEDEMNRSATVVANIPTGEEVSRDTRSPSSVHDDGGNVTSNKKRNRIGKMMVSVDRDRGQLTLDHGLHGELLNSNNMKTILRLMYLLSPVRPQRLLQKVIRNFCDSKDIRRIVLETFLALLGDDSVKANQAMKELDTTSAAVNAESVAAHLPFPPSKLIGIDPRVDDDSIQRVILFRRRLASDSSSAGAAIAAYLPVSARGSVASCVLPPVVSRRLVGCMLFLFKHVDRYPIDILDCDQVVSTGRKSFFDSLVGLLGKKIYSLSATNLEELLSVIEVSCTPLSLLSSKYDEDTELTKREKNSALQTNKVWVDVPKTIVSSHRLQLLCSILRLETCKENAVVKISAILKRLCRVQENRKFILREIASVAQLLCYDSVRDLRSLSIRLQDVLSLQRGTLGAERSRVDRHSNLAGTPSSAVTLSSSSSELKLLRVLQTLQSLFQEENDDNDLKKADSAVVNDELLALFDEIDLEPLWSQLTNCLRTVSVLEGVRSFDQADVKDDLNSLVDDSFNHIDEHGSSKKKLHSYVAGLLTRFLPTVEAFFVVHGGASHDVSGSSRLLEFVNTNKVLLNALLRSNQSLLDKGLRAMVHVPQCRNFLDFDVKRQWFKTQVKRLRQQASRRYGSLRLNIRRQHVFEDAYHQLRLRNAEEMRGKLHITFRNEEGVDAGGLSREFFSILAKEIFNPNYALFTSTEDGCTFQPNMHSSINPDHLSYFRFVGRIVGKAILDGYLLDVHFTRSLYKHMLGLKPTYHDMEAIDPDYYKNLQTILEFDLEDIDLDLTFSTDSHSFGRSETIDLIANGRNIKVSEENKKEYVSLICQHRMTTAIEKQIKAYLDGFYEMVKLDLISIFTARELELLISGLPDIDIHDLKKNTEYHGYKATDKEIQWFWNILFSLSRSHKAAFLQFVTGSSKVPLGGFSDLQGMRGIQKFSIHKVAAPEGALMSAHTCFNSLDLPVYRSEDEMREKLLYAIQEGCEGFLFA